MEINMTIIGKRFNHRQMKEMVGKHLYKIENQRIVKVYVIGITINSETDKWEFATTGINNEILFYTPKSAKRWAKKNKIDLLPIY